MGHLAAPNQLGTEGTMQHTKTAQTRLAFDLRAERAAHAATRAEREIAKRALDAATEVLSEECDRRASAESERDALAAEHEQLARPLEGMTIFRNGRREVSACGIWSAAEAALALPLVCKVLEREPPGTECGKRTQDRTR